MDSVYTNARLGDDEQLFDIGVAHGKIEFVVEAGRVSAENHPTIDLKGHIVLPGLVDAHTHLDKTYSTLENQSGTLLEAIRVWRRVRPTRTYEMVQQSARRALNMAIANGVTAMRSHIDIADEALIPLRAILDLREELREQIDLQIVALGSAAAQRPFLERAMQLGADLVGGAPALCSDPLAEIDAAFAVAEKFGRNIDLHIDETENPNTLTLNYLADKTIEHNMQGHVTAGHCCSLAFVDDETAKRVIDKVAAAQLNIVTLPSCNLVLMGRHIHPTPRGTTRVKELLAAGVNVCAASDNVRDPFNPFGSYDLLQIANLNAHVAHMTGESELRDCLEMVTTRAASTMGFNNYKGITVGSRADFVVLDTDHWLDAVISPPPRLATIKDGKLIVETKIERRWHRD